MTAILLQDTVTESLPNVAVFFPVFWRPFCKNGRNFVCIIIHLEVININVRNFNFPIGFYSKPHRLWTPQNMTSPLYHKAENFRTNQKHISITPPSFMKFCSVVPEICRRHVHVAKKERRIIIIIIIITRYDYNLTIMKSQVSQTGH